MRSLLDGMHQLRARVFPGWLGWQVRIEQGHERDEYDALGPTYILALTDHGDVAGCARLLPTIDPNMLSQTFPQLLASGRLRAKPTRIESSRFCVDSQREGRGGRFLHEAILTMFAGVIEWSMSNGYDEIVTATDVLFERILQRAGWPMTRLGGVELIGETMSVAGILPADRTSFEQVYPPGYCSDLRRLKRAAA
jgi:acyl homoserine lactone synthase